MAWAGRPLRCIYFSKKTKQEKISQVRAKLAILLADRQIKSTATNVNQRVTGATE